MLPADERRKNVVWVKPKLVVEAEFRGVTHGGLLRQASYKGFREDKAAEEVVREVPVARATGAQRQVDAKIGTSAAVARRRNRQTKRPKPARASKNKDAEDRRPST